MKKLFLIGLLLYAQQAMAQKIDTLKNKFVIVVHGGAGTINKATMTAEQERAYKEGIEAAVRKGHDILKKGGSAMDAVTEAVKVLEDNPLFNAGKGAVFTNAGTNELDASVMDGKTLMAGAVAGIRTVKNPVTAARAVMENSEHVLLSGKGADEFAAKNGCEIVDTTYFYTEPRYQGLKRVQEAEKKKTSYNVSMRDSLLLAVSDNTVANSKFGTVGAVALDRHGNLAAATSTGGMTNKRYGRIGDTPIIGAGTYANNTTCAVSCTGWGEYFIRVSVAKTVSDQIKYAGTEINKAAQNALDEVKTLGGDGGLIAVDKNGNISMKFNTSGMYRGFCNEKGSIFADIF